MRNVHIELSGKEGIFTVEKRVGMFHIHSTLETLETTLQGVKKEVNKMRQVYDTMITVTSSDLDCGDTKNHLRFIVRSWQVDGLFTLEVRKFNGYDYSNKQELSFTSVPQLFKYLMTELHKVCSWKLGDIPADGGGWYAKKLDNMEVPSYIS